MTWDIFLQQLINGFNFGSIYALLAIGYSMVYGILRLINFAFGEIFVIGLFTTFFAFTAQKLPFLLSVIVGVVIASLIGIIIERAVYRPLRKAEETAVLLVSLAVYIFLENLVILLIGPALRVFPTPRWLSGVYLLMDIIAVPKVIVFTLITSISLMIVINLFLSKTKAGIAMRAISYDLEMGEILGVNANQIISLAFLIGSALAAVGGITWGMKFTRILPVMGWAPGLKAFIACVIGGIGSIKGAITGGFLLGLAEILFVAFLPAGFSAYRDVLVYFLLIAILLIKPEGIFGGEKREG